MATNGFRNPIMIEVVAFGKISELISVLMKAVLKVKS
jgi:hypothetical protein